MDATPLLVGGFGLPALLLRQLARDVDGVIVRTGFTVGCGEVEVRKVVDAIDRADGDVVLIGHSRGGQLAYVAAARRPDRVRHLITAGMPTTIGPPTRWGVPLVAAAMRQLPTPIAMNCATDECCASFRADLHHELDVPSTAIVSRRDRIVPRHDALVDGAHVVELDTSHIGLVTSAQGRAEIVRRVRCEPSARCHRDEGPA